MFSETVNALLTELGVDLARVDAQTDFNYGEDGRLGGGMYFDAETYGHDVLIPNFSFRHGNRAKILEQLDLVPVSAESRESLRRFYSTKTDVLAGRSPEDRERYLRGISYTEFLRKHGGLTEEAVELFIKATHGYWGVGADGLSVAESEGAGLPMAHLLGGELETPGGSVRGETSQFPDGNASIARLLVRELIPDVAPGHGMDDIVTAVFDYSRLDRTNAPVRLRLNATAVRVMEQGNSVHVTYVREGETLRVRAGNVVLACYHAIIPFLCPQLPELQKEALAYQVKRPLLLTNVLLRSSAAHDQLGISGAYCPGRLHGATWLIKGVQGGSYRHEWSDQGPVVMQFWGSVDPGVRGVDARTQHRLSRARLLAMTFEELEREVRVVSQGMLGSAGFSAADDILAITVNRWPHGYAYDYLDLWDPEWPPGEAPHEIARRRFGSIVFANSDAGANAYTHVAIDEAWRAVNDLVD